MWLRFRNYAVAILLFQILVVLIAAILLTNVTWLGERLANALRGPIVTQPAEALVIWDEDMNIFSLPETVGQLYQPGVTKHILLVHDLSTAQTTWTGDQLQGQESVTIQHIDSSSLSRTTQQLETFFAAHRVASVTAVGAWQQGRRDVCTLRTAVGDSTSIGFSGTQSGFAETNWWSSEIGIIGITTEIAKIAYTSFAYQIPFSGCWSGDFPFVLVILGALTAFVLSGLLVGALRSFTLRRKLLDVANDRSLHHTPTPRGGGAAISTLTLLLLFGIALSFSDLSVPLLVAYIAMGAMLTGVSLYDDWVKAVPTKVRLLFHLAAGLIVAGMTFALRPPVMAIPIPGVMLVSVTGVIAFGLVTIWITGFTNMFNFMDGIDGIAGLQAVLAGAGWSILFLLEGESTLTLISLLVAATSAGFLVHNTAPARIFMGDSGSVFLGFTLASLPVLGFVGTGNPDIFVVGAMLVLPFVVDASYTIVKRWRSGENVLEAHRKHLYQRLILRGHTHGGVTGLYGVMGVICVASGVLYYTGDSVGRAVALGVVITMMTTYIISTEYTLAVKPDVHLHKTAAAEPVIMSRSILSSQD